MENYTSSTLSDSTNLLTRYQPTHLSPRCHQNQEFEAFILLSIS